MRPKNLRQNRLVRPRLQVRLILAFLGVATFALLMQYVLFASALSAAAAELPHDGELFLESAFGISLVILAISLGVLLPLTLFVGVIVTFRIAGPVHRFQTHLRSVADGIDPGVCRIRKGDELHDLCAILNSALDRMRRNGAFEPGTEREAAGVVETEAA